MHVPPTTRVPVSVVIMTKNEAAVIRRCIERVAGWADEVLVLDSGSDDGTREIAAAAGATVREQPWLGFARQRQRAVDLARHDWVFCIDADDVVDDALAAGIRQVMAGAGPDPRDGYGADRPAEFFGMLVPSMKNPIRTRASIHLFNRRHGRWNTEQLVHEEAEVPGRVHPLPGKLLHWRSFTLAEQAQRHLSYLELEAGRLAQRGARGRAVKVVGMPVLRFLWCYVARGGWRLGGVGVMHAMLAAHAEFLRQGALWERQHARHLADPPEWLVHNRSPDPAMRSADSPALRQPIGSGPA